MTDNTVGENPYPMNPHSEIPVTIESAASRRAEIVGLLARAYLRLRSRESCAGSADLSSAQSEQSLEHVSETRLCGSQKERIA